ncbi:MAG: AraC family transcriptional regulator [Clostridia bacterium]|nr:AraC family transcriptional regulator [Clostridia bacterium]
MITPNHRIKSVTLLNSLKRHSTDLSVNHYGHETIEGTKAPVDSHSYPAYRLHFIVKGKVTVYYGNGQKATLGKNSVFLLMPGTDIYYVKENERATTEFYWVAFNGYNAKNYTEAIGLHKDKPFAQNLGTRAIAFFKENFETWVKNSKIMDIVFEKNLLRILEVIFQESHGEETIPMPELNKHKSYVQHVLEVTESALSDPSLSIKKIASQLNVHPNYLSRIFKREMSVCYTSYLTLKRMEHAILLIQEGHELVKEIAHSVGFEDELYFSKIYKKYNFRPPIQDIQETKRLKNSPPPLNDNFTLYSFLCKKNGYTRSRFLRKVKPLLLAGAYVFFLRRKCPYGTYLLRLHLMR